MFLVYNHKYIAAVCEKKSTLTNWKKETSIPKSLKIATKNLVFPFYVVEDNEDKVITDPDQKYTFCQTKEEMEIVKSRLKYWTTFTFQKDWKGSNKFDDYMGALTHEHSPEDEDKANG